MSTGLAGVSHAQTAPELADLSLATLLDMEVTGASRFAGRRSESAAAVTVITHEEIRALGHRTLAEALRSVRGVVASGDRTYDYLGVRGFFAGGDYNTRVLLLVDGNRVNDQLYDQAYLGTEFPIDLDLVERIEFVSGPGSAVYGANALFGVINVITRSTAGRAEAHARVSLGSDGLRALRASWQRPTAQGGWQLAFSRSLEAGEALAEVAPVGMALTPAPRGAEAPGAPAIAGLDPERRSALYARWDHGPWTASLSHVDRLKGSPYVAGQVFGDPLPRFRDTLTLASLQFEQTLGRGEQFTARVQAGSYRFLGDYLFDYPPLTVNRDVGRGRWWGLEARLTSTRVAGHRLVVGAEWQRAWDLTQQNFDLRPGTERYLDDRRSRDRGALFGEDQWKLLEHWTLHLGARIDEVSGGGHASSPRIALAWRPDAAWSVKAIHGRSFRAPNAYEAFYAVDIPAGYQLNPGLRPERVRGDELSVEWLPAPAWRWSGSLYRNRASGLLILGYDDASDRFRFDNAGAFGARGAELELEHVRGALRWRLNASLNQDLSHTAVSGPMLYPRRMLKGTAIVPLAAQWRLGTEFAAVSRRGAAAGHALLNLTLSGPLPALGARVQFSLRNALDRDARDPGPDTQWLPTVPQPRRSWRLELDWPFGA
ncbi:MAG: TonB-dependent receptor [Burkholderiales bacterium]|nr:TonB-dependent receptor [Burkholderiales bacterium]